MYLEKFMLEAYKLAALGNGTVSPNPMVGAVVVQDREIVGKGYHRKAGSDHAEVIALNDAGDKSKGADLYVTLEPCAHHGKTPPCVDKIIACGIKRVFIGCIDPNPLVSGKGIAILENHGIEVHYGYLENLLLEQNRYFFHWIKTGLPYINLKYAMTLDGRIANHKGESKWISNELAREKVQIIRGEVDGILVGINTVLKDNPRLTYRLGAKEQPYKIICDSHLQCPLDSEVIVHNPHKTIIATLVTNKDLIAKYTALGVTIIPCLPKDGRINLRDLCQKLGAAKILSILVEGGATIHGSFIDEHLVNRIYTFIAPKIMSQGLPPILGNGGENMSQLPELKNVVITTMKDNILVQGDYPSVTNGGKPCLQA